MRTLTFTPGAESYELLHEVTLLSRAQLSPQQFRLTAKVQDRLESIGVPKKADAEKKLGSIIPFVCPKGGAVTFEEAEWGVLRHLLEGFPATAALARAVAGLWDLIDATKEETPSATKAGDADA